MSTALFTDLHDAHQFARLKGRDFTPCASTDKRYPWQVRPKTDGEIARDAEYREQAKQEAREFVAINE